MKNEGPTVPLKEYFEALRKADRELNRTKFRSIQRALKIAAREADKKNTELNDVRHRFIPREVFDTYRESQQRRARAIIVTFVLMGLTIVGLILQLLK
jgi:hypothetical protein